MSCYTSTFLQFVTDQQVEVSSEEVAFTVYWLCWSVVFAAVVGLAVECVVSEVTMLISLAVAVLSWFVAVVVLLKYGH